MTNYVDKVDNSNDGYGVCAIIIITVVIINNINIVTTLPPPTFYPPQRKTPSDFCLPLTKIYIITFLKSTFRACVLKDVCVFF